MKRAWALTRMALGLAAFVLGAGAGAVAAAEPAVPLEPHPAAGDVELMWEILDQRQVERVVPAPGWSGYAEELGRRLGLGLRRFFERLLPKVPLPSAATLRGGVIALLAGIATFLLYVLLQRRRARPPHRDDPVLEPVAVPLQGPAGAAARDAAGWRSELDRYLAEGRLVEALEATWWWLARTLAGERAEASWTGRELLLHAGRPELAGELRQLELMTYGPRRPSPEEVGGLVGELARRLA